MWLKTKDTQMLIPNVKESLHIQLTSPVDGGREKGKALKGTIWHRIQYKPSECESLFL